MKIFILFILSSYAALAENTLRSYVIEPSDLVKLLKDTFPNKLAPEDEDGSSDDPFADDAFEDFSFKTPQAPLALYAYLQRIHPPKLDSYFSEDDTTYDCAALFQFLRINLPLESWAIYNQSTNRLLVYACDTDQQRIKYTLDISTPLAPKQWTTTVSIKQQPNTKIQFTHQDEESASSMIGDFKINISTSTHLSSTTLYVSYQDAKIIASSKFKFVENKAWELPIKSHGISLIIHHHYRETLIPPAADGSIYPQRTSSTIAPEPQSKPTSSLATYRVPPDFLIYISSSGSDGGDVFDEENQPAFSYNNPYARYARLEATDLPGYMNIGDEIYDASEVLIMSGIPIPAPHWAVFNRTKCTLVVYAPPSSLSLIRLLTTTIGHYTPAIISLYADIISQPIDEPNAKETIHSSFFISGKSGERLTNEMLLLNNLDTDHRIDLEPSLSEDGISIEAKITIDSPNQKMTLSQTFRDGVEQVSPLYTKDNRRYSLKTTLHIHRFNNHDH